MNEIADKIKELSNIEKAKKSKVTKYYAQPFILIGLANGFKKKGIKDIVENAFFIFLINAIVTGFIFFINAILLSLFKIDFPYYIIPTLVFLVFNISNLIWYNKYAYKEIEYDKDLEHLNKKENELKENLKKELLNLDIKKYENRDYSFYENLSDDERLVLEKREFFIQEEEKRKKAIRENDVIYQKYGKKDEIENDKKIKIMNS